MLARSWVLLPFLGLLGALYLALVWAPPDRLMGEVQRLMYFHVAAALNAFLAFAVLVAAGLAYLKTRAARWDRLAYASGEIGVLLTTITLLSGSFWARAVWGVWWTWEPRLTTTLLLWFLYVGYLVIRAAAEGDERRARLATVFGILGFADVPVVYFAVTWWQGVHPGTLTSGELEIDPAMAVALRASIAAMSLLYLFLLQHRLRLEALREEVALLKERWR